MAATLRGNVDKNCRISATQKIIWLQCAGRRHFILFTTKSRTSAAVTNHRINGLFNPRPIRAQAILNFAFQPQDHVAAERRLTGRVAAPPTLRSMEWHAVSLFFKTADVREGSNSDLGPHLSLVRSSLNNGHSARRLGASSITAKNTVTQWMVVIEHR